MTNEGNRLLRGGMQPLYHCACKAAVVTTANEKCQYCARGIKRPPYSIPEAPPKIKWTQRSAK